jgi:hypothetical protein
MGYDLSILKNKLIFSQNDAADYLDMDKGRFSLIRANKGGLSADRLMALLELDTLLIQCDEQGVVMDEMEQLKNQEKIIRIEYLAKRKEQCAAELIRLGKKLDEMKAICEKNKTTLNYLLYIIANGTNLTERQLNYMRLRIYPHSIAVESNGLNEQQILSTKLHLAKTELKLIDDELIELSQP